MTSNRRGLYIFGAVVLAGAVFQLFFRYEYIHLSGAGVMRVDRLTKASCVLPCTEDPTPEPTPSEANSSSERINTDAKIINRQREVYRLTYNDTNSDWKIIGHYAADGTEDPSDSKATPDSGGTDTTKTYPVRVVCYCDKNNTGYYYEVTSTTYGGIEDIEITGNTVLENKYHMSRSTTSH
jgi:hypothetical protein